MENHEIENFQHQWGFRKRRNDYASLNDHDHSKSGLPVLESHKLVSNLIPADNPLAEMKSKKHHLGKKPERDKEKDTDPKVGRNRKKRQRKANDNSNNNAALDDLKKFIESLLENRKVTKESLLTWMKEEIVKLSATDDISPERERTSRPKRAEIDFALDNSDQQNFVVLAIEAPNCRNGTMKKSLKEKKTAQINNDSQQITPEDLCYKPDMGFMFSNEERKHETFGSLFDPNSPSNPFFNNLNPSCSYVQPRVLTDNGSVHPGLQSQIYNMDALYGFSQTLLSEDV
ncbi:hypothetical protein ACFE04_005377 [Oxalis oulophora]